MDGRNEEKRRRNREGESERRQRREGLHGRTKHIKRRKKGTKEGGGV